MSSERDKAAHDELRRRGMTDDVHATATCAVMVLFWISGLAAIIAAVAGVA